MRAMWAHELTWEFVFGPSKPGGLGLSLFSVLVNLGAWALTRI